MIHLFIVSRLFPSPNAFMPFLSSAHQRMLCAALQEGPQLLPEQQKPSHGLPEGFVTAKLSGNFWRHLSCFHAAHKTDRATEVFWSKAIKRKIQLWHGQKISAEPGVHSGHSSSSGTPQAWSGQVQSHANDYSQFFSLDPNFCNSFTFCSDDHACPCTTALTAEKRLCWRIKPKAPMGVTEDQIIHIGENLWNCCIKS